MRKREPSIDVASQQRADRLDTLEKAADVPPGKRSGRALRLTGVAGAFLCALCVAAVARQRLISSHDADRAAAIAPSRPTLRQESARRNVPTATTHFVLQATDTRTVDSEVIRLCQAYGPLPVPQQSYEVVPPSRSIPCGPCMDQGWTHCSQFPYDPYGQGRYVEPGRTRHVYEYRLRADDELDFVYRLTRDQQTEPYELNIGDEIRVESIADPALNRDLIVQPDGTITLLLLGQVMATRQTITQLRDRIDELYLEFYNEPTITVTPLKVNTKLDDLRATVDARQGFGGQSRRARVTPEGTIQLPAIGSIQVNGMTLSEVQREVNARYAAVVKGIGLTAVLTQRAPRSIYVLGEVRQPGRFTLEGPTTLMQALALAGSWNVGANLNQVVVFRRDYDWQLTATMLDIRGALFARDRCPDGEIWLADSDVVVVPQSRILQIDNIINLVFTRGVYGVAPFNGISVNFAKLSSL